MLSILRQGPKLIVFGSSKPEGLVSFLERKFNGILSDINSALEIADEDSTIVFITNPGKKIVKLKDVIFAVVIPMPSDTMFAEILSCKGINLIDDSHIAPGTIVMRSLGNFEKILNSVNEAYNGKILSLFQCLDEGTYCDTIISFTEKPLNEKLHIEDINPKHILVNMSRNMLYKKLKNQALRFINEGLVGVDWYDIQIRIYDRYSKYKLHYNKLSIVLDNCDIGLVLGESWGKDYPRFLMSVLVYQVRMFTLIKPIEIKKMLLGLEYLEDGTRIADFDLIFKNKKIDWIEVLDKELKGINRAEVGKKYRKELLEKLGKEDKEKLMKLDEEILKSRY